MYKTGYFVILLMQKCLMLEIAENLPALFQSYGAPVPVNNIVLDNDALSELKEISSAMPEIDWANANLAPEIVARIKAVGGEQAPALSAQMQSARQSYRDHGVCVISLGGDVDPEKIDDVKKQLVCLLGAFGLPFGAFHDKGFWQTLGVNKNAASLRAESTGYIPLHIDFDQASDPPDGVALFCLRPDPRGGGESTVFHYPKFLSLLPDDQREKLGAINYSYSTLFRQNGIGEVYNPHPLIDPVRGSPFFRYNGKVLPDLSPEHSELFLAMEQQFKSASSVYALKTGDMIVLDQNSTLHGRLPLAHREDGQSFPASEDRLLLQTYLRHGL